jgi:threonine dehydrogenase-like Zn-dependent dehydrogenase
MKALIIERKISRFAAARVASMLGSGRGAGVGPLRLTEAKAPRDLGEHWYPITPTLAGICGSDLATIDGRSSQYFEHLVSFPFVPGHEVLGTMDVDGLDASGASLLKGDRVVIQPVLGCATRGLALCADCQRGDVERCQYLSVGHLHAGLQTGYCADTGGGWSEGPLQAHQSQLFKVPDDLSDEDAVTIEPMACALHAAISADHKPDSIVAVVGSGTLGLGVVAALSFLDRSSRRPRPKRVVVGARYPNQRHMATALGADEVVTPEQLPRAVRMATRSMVSGEPTGESGQLTGGADIVLDCVGSAESIEQSLKIVRPGGRIVMVGMPGKVTVDLAGLWQREVELVGTYAYGAERFGDESVSTFDLAIELARHHQTGSLVSARYPIDRFEEALSHAGSAGPRGAVKIVFDLRPIKAPRREGGLQ